jgi:hypothetical protein
MPVFNYNDIVRIKGDKEPQLRHDRAWIVGIFEEREGEYFNRFPPGVVYTIEFDDGSSTEVHEGSLEPDPSRFGGEPPAAASSEGQELQPGI